MKAAGRHIVDLIRLKRPVGILLLLYPCWWGLIAGGATNITLYALFALGALIMRSAGCVINDLADRQYDRRIERTRHRPLAARRLPLGTAMITLGVLLGAGAMILLTLPLEVVIVGLIVLPWIFLYPLAKRWIAWPQILLGLLFNAGAVMGWLAAQAEPSPVLLALYAGGFFWTLYYDTIYALQDRGGDRALGLGSSALALGRHWYGGIAFFQGMALLCWGMAGWLGDFGWGFWPIFALLVLDLGRQRRILRRQGARAADTLFRANGRSGAILTAALAVSRMNLPFLP